MNLKINKRYKVWLSNSFLIFSVVFNIILSYKTFVSTTSNINAFYLQIGISIIFYFLLIITFIQYFFFREATYYYYLLYLLLYLCYFTLVASYYIDISDDFIPNFKKVRSVLSLLVLISSYAVYTFFAIAFLSAKTKDFILYKRLKLLAFIYLSMLGVILVSYIIGSTFGETLRTVLLTSCIPLGIVGIGIIYARAKNVFGYILCAGSTFIFIGSVLGFLFSYKILSYPINKFPFNNWLFYTMAGSVLEVVMFFSSFAFRNKVLATEEQVSKEKLQSIRDEISRDLHDDVGATLSNINILNEMAKRNADNPLKATEYLDRASEDIQQVSESLSDIVWNINSRYDDVENLFIRMKRYAADMLEGKNIDYEIEFPEHAANLKIGIDKRKDFYFIFKEGINNIIKYSDATKATVTIKLKHQLLELAIIDNGKGFSKEKINGGNGLQNMQHRALVWDATFKIETEIGKGTSIHLKMKLN